MKTLHFQINPHSGVPVYRQAMDQVKYYLASGSLKPGDQLPSIREMAQLLAVNPTTIVKTYSELEHAGIIEMRHGKGAFISVRANRVSDLDRHTTLRDLAKHLVVEGAQMGASSEEILQAVQEQIGELDSAQPSPLAASRSRRFANG